MQRVLEYAAEGVSLSAMCRLPGMPAPITVITWRQTDPTFSKAYDDARRHLAERYAQDVVDLADSARGLDAAGVQAVRLAVDTRKWVASKILPHTYGDNVQVQHSGSLSIASISDRLRKVEPVTIDGEWEDATDTGQDAAGNAHASPGAGTLLACEVSANGGGERLLTAESPTHGDPHPQGAAPGNGTPITMPSPASGIPKNSKKMSKVRPPKPYAGSELQKARENLKLPKPTGKLLDSFSTLL